MQVAFGLDLVQPVLDMLALDRIRRAIPVLAQLVFLMLQRFAMLAMMLPTVVIVGAHARERYYGQDSQGGQDKQAFQHNGLPVFVVRDH